MCFLLLQVCGRRSVVTEPVIKLSPTGSSCYSLLDVRAPCSCCKSCWAGGGCAATAEKPSKSPQKTEWLNIKKIKIILDFLTWLNADAGSVTHQYSNTVSTLKVFASSLASWPLGGQNVTMDHFQFSFHFLSFFSSECDNQLYLVPVHLVLLCQSRISVLLFSCLSNDNSLLVFLFSKVHIYCTSSHIPTVVHHFFSATKRLSLALLLHVSLSSVCFLWERCGIVYQRVPLGFDRIILLGIRFLSFGPEEQSYSEQLSISVALSWGIHVPSASSPGS